MAKKNAGELRSKLEGFQKEFRVFSVGGLGTALVLTRKAKRMGLPLNLRTLNTRGGGQVSGLSGAAINKILREHGEIRRVGTESGRTSRGTPGLAQQYAAFLNKIAAGSAARLDEMEQWWVAKFVEYFDTEPFVLKYDQSKTLAAALQDLLDQASERQRRSPGKTYVGAMLEHLIGAKLELALSEKKIVHHGFSTADKLERAGDFDLDDVVIHCTTTPTPALIAKCETNLHSGKRPIILTRSTMIAAAAELAKGSGIVDRVEVMDALQFVAMNLYELSLSKSVERQVTVESLVGTYNQIVSTNEADQSLQIKIR